LSGRREQIVIEDAGAAEQAGARVVTQWIAPALAPIAAGA